MITLVLLNKKTLTPSDPLGTICATFIWDKLEQRARIIAPDGTVLFDSREDKQKYEREKCVRKILERHIVVFFRESDQLWVCAVQSPHGPLIRKSENEEEVRSVRENLITAIVEILEGL